MPNIKIYMRTPTLTTIIVIFYILGYQYYQDDCYWDYEKESGMPSIALNGISSQGGDRGWQTLVEGLVAAAKNAIKCLCLRKS
ncbi:MAG: hypothetical protein WA461_15390, partial [Nitrososphaeraceae archaeon]